jgi:hypothetical protein
MSLSVAVARRREVCRSVIFGESPMSMLVAVPSRHGNRDLGSVQLHALTMSAQHLRIVARPFAKSVFLNFHFEIASVMMSNNGLGKGRARLHIPFSKYVGDIYV